MAQRPDDDKLMGLYVWSEGVTQPKGKDTRANAAIDIIAVQGLGASPYYTWVKKVAVNKAGTGEAKEEKEEVMWLRDLLPVYFKNARIATFSYFSDWFKYKGGAKTCIRDIAQQLLEEVRQYRRRSDADGRPIILIGHSMGGLVVKQALVLASNNPKFENIKRSTVGVIFLGTPHNGTNVAGYAAFVAKVRGNDPALVESLKLNEECLVDLSKDFASGYPNLPIMCFYEASSSDYSKYLPISLSWILPRIEVVEQRSAVREGKAMMYLNADHSGLNKFSGHDDPDFRNVLAVIDEMAKDAEGIIKQNHVGIVRTSGGKMLIPFARDDDFVGREDVITKIDQTFSKCQNVRRAALSGLGGVGKTQIAIEYAYREKERRPNIWVFWVHASNRARFEQSYDLIAHRARVPGIDGPFADVLSLVSGWLESDASGEWLMVLDNADDPSVFSSRSAGQTTLLSEYLPQNSRGSALITSRFRDAAFRLTGKENCIIEVGGMDERDAISLLRKKLPDNESDGEAYNRLIHALGSLPLPLTQAAAYITMQAPRITIEKYLDYFHSSEKDQISLLSKDGGDLRRDGEVSNAIILTWQISFDQIKTQYPSAANLLSRMCILDRQGIPGFLLRQGDTASLDFDDAIGILMGFSLIGAKADDVFEMHRLVQLSTRRWLEIHDELEKNKEEVLYLLSASFPGIINPNCKVCAALEPHAQTVLSNSYTSPKCRLEVAKLVFGRAKYAWVRGDLKAFQHEIDEALEITESLPDDLLRAHILSYRARYFFICRQWKRAEELERQVMKKMKKELGAEHPETLVSLSYLGEIYSNLGRWKEAEEKQLQVLATLKRVYGPEYSDLMNLQYTSHLAMTYFRQGSLDKAEQLFKEVVEIGKSKPEIGLESLATLSSINSLAQTYHCRGRLDEAEELVLEVMETVKRLFGEENSVVLATAVRLSLILRDQGQWKKAEDLLSQAIAGMKRVIGDDHPFTVTGQSDLLILFITQMRWAEAEELAVEVGEKAARVFGEEDRITLSNMSLLGLVYGHQNRFEEAEKLGTCALKRMRRAYGKYDCSTLTTMHNLGFTYLSNGRLRQAKRMYLRVFRRWKISVGESHPSTLGSAHNLAWVLARQGRWSRAINMMGLVVQRRQNVLGSDHPVTIQSSKTLQEWQTNVREAATTG